MVEYSDSYMLVTVTSLWKYYRDEKFFGDNGNIADVPDNPHSDLFKI